MCSGSVRLEVFRLAVAVSLARGSVFNLLLAGPDVRAFKTARHMRVWWRHRVRADEMPERAGILIIR